MDFVRFINGLDHRVTNISRDVFIVFEGGEISEFTMNLVTLLLSVPGYWVLSVGVVLPATALDREPRSLGDAWRQSRPFNKQIFILMGLIPLVVGSVSQFVFAEFTHLFALVVSGVIFGIFGAFQIALLSLSYRTILDIEPRSV